MKSRLSDAKMILLISFIRFPMRGCESLNSDEDGDILSIDVEDLTKEPTLLSFGSLQYLSIITWIRMIRKILPMNQLNQTSTNLK